MKSSNLWFVLLPVLLFIFKYVFPMVCERVFSDRSCSGMGAKVIEELIQFPVDLLFISISYTAPKIIDTIYKLSSLKTDSTNLSNQLVALNLQYTQNLINYCIRCFVMLILLPAFVILTKYAIKLGDEKKSVCQIIFTLFLYTVSILSVVYSLFLYQ